MLKEYVTWLAARTTPAMTIGDDIVAGPFQQDSPDLCTAVLDNAGPVNPWLEKERTMRLQFLTRGPSLFTARDEAYRVFEVAKNATGYALGDWQLHTTPQSIGPQWMGFDERGRNQYSANLIVQVRKPD